MENNPTPPEQPSKATLFFAGISFIILQWRWSVLVLAVMAAVVMFLWNTVVPNLLALPPLKYGDSFVILLLINIIRYNPFSTIGSALFTTTSAIRQLLFSLNTSTVIQTAAIVTKLDELTNSTNKPVDVSKQGDYNTDIVEQQKNENN